MRKVTVIKSLKVLKETMAIHPDDPQFRYHAMSQLPRLADSGAILPEGGLENMTADIKIVPITQVHFSDSKRDDLYIAYTDEVREFLELPIYELRTQVNTLSGLLSDCERRYIDVVMRMEDAKIEILQLRLDLEKASLWNRIKFVFTGKLYL